MAGFGPPFLVATLMPMVAPAAPAALHLLTPGSPAYALLKVGAIGGIFALRFVLGRRSRR
ncbi:MAG: hypothetical protein QOE69_2429 [Thermoleophilaceae bacterium]|jgi:hypothetical protein|nr:hypothetical protein [Thermoleophilaceae bacterium]MEA2408310.1 hypothetical protein [Thermoleophilaceae bacterium]